MFVILVLGEGEGLCLFVIFILFKKNDRGSSLCKWLFGDSFGKANAFLVMENISC